MTKRRVAGLLVGLWTLSALLSHVPIHLGWYTTSERLESRRDDDCTFEVNKVYVVVSSTVSFWTPAAVMVFAYVKIFREARKQERHIRALRKVSMTTTSDVTVQNDDVTVDLILAKCHQDHHDHQKQQLSEKQLRHHHHRQNMSEFNRTRLQRDNKAAKTLGLIMGAFLCCWAPFFTWYVVSTLCDGVCGGFGAAATPPTVVSVLFWVGYLNSVLNPFIYAFYNREFRRAFAVLLSCSHRSLCPRSVASAIPPQPNHRSPSASAAKSSSAPTMTSHHHCRRKRNYVDASSASGSGGRLESAVAFLCSGKDGD